MLKFLLLAISVSISQFLTAQTLSAEEQKLIDVIRKNIPSDIQMLKKLVDINSGTLNVKGVRQTGNELSAAFKKLGFNSEWIKLPDSLKRGGHLVVSRKGTKGKKIFLIGHLDTVFEPDMPTNPFRMLNDSTATGQGASDMKGGDVIIYAALHALFEAGLLNDVNVTAYFTGDEEKAGQPTTVSRADFIERAKQHDIALGFEGAQGLNTVAVGRRGSSSWRLRVNAPQAHSAGMFRNNYGSIYEASRILNNFREQLGNEKNVTFSPGLFAGGAELIYDSGNVKASVSGKTNIISPVTVVEGDLRYLTEEQLTRTRENMRKIVSSDNLPGTQATIQFFDGIPNMGPTEGNYKLVTLLNDISTAIGIGETKAGDPGSRGGGDISYIAKYVDCIDGLGASGTGAHAPGETINLKEFPKLIERAALLIYRLTR
jgi:glutamate carboxypeptidase